MADDGAKAGKATQAADAPRITFLCDPAVEDRLPPPQPANRFLPDWFTSLDREMGMPDPHGLPGLTVKACMPVTDAFSLGWIIPLACDVRFMVDESGTGIQAGWPPDAPFQPIEQHHPGQIGAPAAPFERTVPLKWINPWRIKVPEGYSVLFLHPLNHFELPFRCFSGLVDCDRFDTTVNFPFAWTEAPADVTLARGTPIIQLVPVRREALLQGCEVRASTDRELAEQKAAAEKKYGFASTYRREWRVKK